MNEPAEGAEDGVKAENADGGIEIQAELSRDLGLVSALAIGVGTMIAAGIFTLSGLAVKEVGSAAIAAFLVAAVVATFTALTYCEFASIYPQSGEGYLYARKTFAPPLAYTVGWCLLLGYTSSCGFYIASLSSYFNEFVLPERFHHLQEQFPLLVNLSGLIALGALTLLNIKGTKESGSFQIVVTVGKVILLTIFVGGGIMAFNSDTAPLMVEKFSTDALKIGSTAALVFITFFGFSAIAASAGEVQNPTKTIPRAIFISMGIVTVLYTLVVAVILAAGLTEYNEAAMGAAAQLFLGPVGGAVIVGGALFSMVSASNASIMAGSRVTMAMAALGHLPAALARVHPRTRTPVVALFVVGSTIGLFAVILPLEDLAHFADTVLLLALILVNAALIVHRRRHPDLERPFRVPFVPLLPGMGIVANLYLLSQIAHHGLPFWMAITTLLVGMLCFLVWKGLRSEEHQMAGEPSWVAHEHAPAVASRFRVLVPIANPANINSFIDLAACVAKERDGEIIALRVVTVPEQTIPTLQDEVIQGEAELLEQARARAAEKGVPVTSLVVVGHNVARAILEAAHSRSCDLIVLGWKGYTSTARRILGEITDTVVTHAKADIVVMKRVGDGPVRRFLLPTAGGEHAQRAEAYTASLARTLDGTITLCKVIGAQAEPELAAQAQTTLDEASERLARVDQVDRKLLRSDDVVDAILAEAQAHDAIVIGAAGPASYRQLLMGTVPETVARSADRTVIIVKRHNRVKAMIGRVLAA